MARSSSDGDNASLSDSISVSDRRYHPDVDANSRSKYTMPLAHATSLPPLSHCLGDANEATGLSLPVDAVILSHSHNDVLDRLLKKHSDHYRYITIPPIAEGFPNPRESFQKRISFDTINLQYLEHNDYTDDYPVERGRTILSSPSRALSPNSQLSPGRLPLPYRSQDLSRLNQQELARLLKISKQYAPEYPTRPIVTHRGCTYTKVHRDFENLYLGHIKTPSGRVHRPVLPSRVILVYISARKHTWVALDWILNHFIEDGDTIIVVAALPPQLLDRPLRPYSNAACLGPAMTAKSRLRRRCMPSYSKEIAKNIMTYCMRVIKPGAICKISVELLIGDTKAVLKDMYKLYEPNLICTGSKPSVGKSPPLKSWNSAKLTDRLVKNFPLPVIVVPAINMAGFEDDIAHSDQLPSVKSSSVARDDSQNDPTKARTTNEPAQDSIEDELDESCLVSSTRSSQSYLSYDEIAHLYSVYEREIANGKKKILAKPVDKDRFVDLVKLVLDKLADLCSDLREIDPDFRGEGAKLARAITGLNSFGIVPYKSRLMLSPSEPQHDRLGLGTSTTLHAPRGMLYKETMKRLQAGAASPSPPKLPPSVLVSSPPPMENRKTKFVGIDDQSISLALPASSDARAISNSKYRHKLMRSLSHEAYSDSRRPQLTPSVSEPDYEHKGNVEHNLLQKPKSKSRMKKLFKLFG